MSEIKTNQDLVNNLYADMIKSNQPQEEPQGDEPSGKDNLNNPTAVEEPVVENQEPEVSDDGLEPSDATNPTGEKVDNDVVEEPVAVEDEDDGIFENWFNDEPTTEPTAEDNVPTLNYSEIAKELGIEANTKEELVTAYNKLKEDAQKANEFANLPLDLNEAIQLAKQGQDYKIVFAESDSIDHKIYDDRTLLLNQNAKYFTNPEGQVDQDALTEYVDDMTENQQKIEASKIREQIDEYNLRTREQKAAERIQKQKEIQNELLNTANSISDIKGFKVTPQHKEEIVKAITTGNAMKELFYKDDGKTYDMQKVFTTYFIAKNFDKIKNFLTTRAANSVKKEEFEKISNANVNRPESHPEAIVKEPEDLTTQYLNFLREQNGIIQK